MEVFSARLQLPLVQTRATANGDAAEPFRGGWSVIHQLAQCYLSVCVFVVLVGPGMVILLYEAKVFFSLPP